MVDVSLYFHVPFCSKKCLYCHFFVLPDKEDSQITYIQSLEREWELKKPLLAGKNIASIYFGGGTPALLGPEKIASILSWTGPASEITLEANPENITEPKMRAFKEAGINRVSIGVQTLHTPLLKTLGRAHSAEKAIEAVYATRAAGIDNLSIDLMYDLPSQSFADWEATVGRACTLPITHLSLYNLTFEPTSAFYKNKEALQHTLPDPETSLHMLESATAMLEAAGLPRYEISAFGTPSVHNTGYWTGRPFLGLGPSAFSYWEGARFRNVCHLKKYAAALEKNEEPIDFFERLALEDQKNELLAIGLRRLVGVTLERPLPKSLFSLAEAGLVAIEGGHVRLTPKGMLFYDEVAAQII